MRRTVTFVTEWLVHFPHCFTSLITRMMLCSVSSGQQNHITSGSLNISYRPKQISSFDNLWRTVRTQVLRIVFNINTVERFRKSFDYIFCIWDILKRGSFFYYTLANEKTVNFYKFGLSRSGFTVSLVLSCHFIPVQCSRRVDGKSELCQNFADPFYLLWAVPHWTVFGFDCRYTYNFLYSVSAGKGSTIYHTNLPTSWFLIYCISTLIEVTIEE